MRAAVLLCALAMMACNDGKEVGQPAEEGPEVKADADQETATEVGKELFLWAVPILKTHEAISRMALNRDSADFLAGPNEIMRIEGLMDATFSGIPETSSAILYMGAVLDLRAEPQVFTFPEVPDRYHSFQFSDLHGYNFAYAGTRATSGKGGLYVVAGPDWEGELPEDATLIESESNVVMVVGRVLPDASGDLTAATKVLDQVTLLPLSRYLGTDPPPAPSKPLPLFEEEQMGVDYIALLSELLALAEPHPDDQDEIRRFSTFGLDFDGDFERSELTPAEEKALNAGIQEGRQALRQALTTSGENGWSGYKRLYGTRADMRDRDLDRAVGAVVGLLDASPEEILYRRALVDGDGQALDGSAGSYTITFPAGQLPPSDVKWSVTPYELPNRNLVRSEHDKYVVTSREALQKGPDGSITISLSASKPEGETTNWLPVPEGPFTVVLRMYLVPEESQDYVPPPIQRQE